MEFCDKLDFLMNLTSSSNSALSLAVSLDPSHVSRLRRGGRRLPKRADFLLPMAHFFSRRILNEYQKKALGDALRIPGEFPADENGRARLLYRFLSGEMDSDGPIEAFLEYFSQFQIKKAPPAHRLEESGSVGLENTEYYYGPEGKREAVLAFLTSVLSEKNPQTLLLYSDEEMSWLFDDAAFSKKWAYLLAQVLETGNTIKIIHTISRSMDEVLTAIAKWLPIYMTGKIAPWYYPKIRDGIFRRTLFLAPRTSAVVSSSVQNRTHGMLNLYLNDPNAIAALIKEFNAYLSLCRPLMRIFTGREAGDFLSLLREFEAESVPAVLHPQYLSLLTLPRQEAESMMRRAEVDGLLSGYIDRMRQFEETLQDHSLYEMICIPDAEMIRAGKVPLPLSDMAHHDGLYYTPGEFRLHLEHIIFLLRTYRNYHVMLRDYDGEGYLLYASA